MEATISKPLYRILSDLTGEMRFDVALHLAVKELLELKLKEAEAQSRALAERYQMNFESFREAWQEDRIPEKYTYEVERDYWEWEAAVTDAQRLREMLDQLP